MLVCQSMRCCEGRLHVFGIGGLHPTGSPAAQLRFDDVIGQVAPKLSNMAAADAAGSPPAAIPAVNAPLDPPAGPTAEPDDVDAATLAAQLAEGAANDANTIASAAAAGGIDTGEDGPEASPPTAAAPGPGAPALCAVCQQAQAKVATTLFARR